MCHARVYFLRDMGQLKYGQPLTICILTRSSYDKVDEEIIAYIVHHFHSDGSFLATRELPTPNW